MTDNKTTPNIFFVEALLHLLFLIGAFMFFNPWINFPYPSENKYELIKYYSLLTIEVSSAFLLITMQFRLKVDRGLFLLIILVIFPTFFIFGKSMQELFNILAKDNQSPEIHTFFKHYIFKYYNRYVSITPLIIYISGYINKKLFWIIASIPIACFFFSVIWFFILSEPLNYSHIGDNTFTR